MNDTASGPGRWSEAWMDGLAFAGGLALAWFFKWKTTDLVWSLWLSSLVVGYTTLVWMILRETVARRRDSAGRARSLAGTAAGLGGALFLLGFFTVHYGGFHFGHSVFLNVFFPADGSPRGGGQFPGLATYAKVFLDYCWFLPIAFLAERQAFRTKQEDEKFNLMAPYKNVVRMHLLIFFFAFTYMVGLESFFTYVVVYAVYFFPWRLLAKKKTAAVAE